MKNQNLIQIITFLFICCINSSFLQAQMSEKEIDQLVENTMKTFDVPGIAVAIVKDDAVIHEKGYGLRSLNGKTKVDKNTLFGIASNSKAFTAAALAILMDEGKLTWDDKVIDYIPEFRLYNPYVTEEFTIRDLLTHRSGLGLGAGDLMIFPDGGDYTIDDLIHNLRYLKQVSSFRSQFDYDNLLYIVAGEIVARVSGKPWDVFVEERIMKPLGMSQSAGNFNRVKDKSNLADAHAPVDEKVIVVDRYDLPLCGAAGGIYSNIHDMSKWIITQLNKGKYGEKQDQELFSEKRHQDMWSAQTILRANGGGPYKTHFSAYGLGWGLSNVKEYKQVTHTGGLPGMVTQVTMIPELKLGIVVLTNQQSGSAFSAITKQIKDSYFGMEKVDRVAENKERLDKYVARAKKVTDKVWADVAAVQKENKNTLDLNQFAGTYKDNWLGEITINQKDNQLWFAAKRSPKLAGEMVYYKGNTFIVKWNDRSLDADAYVMFELDHEGKANGIKMKAVSPLTDFSYDFHDLDFERVGE